MAPSFGAYKDEKEGAVLCGVLGKLGKSGRTHQRFFLIKHGNLVCYQIEDALSPKHVTHIASCQVEEMFVPEKRLFGFVVSKSSQSETMVAQSKDEAMAWINALRAKGSRTAASQSHTRLANDIRELYDVQRELGSGGFSTVYLGIHKETKEQWALKMITRAVFKRNRLQVEEEVNVMAQLSHPGVVCMREVISTPTHYIIVMELLEGGELFDRIVQRERYNENDARVIARSIFETIRYLHGHHIVHRDLKPENLLFVHGGEDAELKLTDFGFATMFDEKHKLTATCGTPEYVAPEILKQVPYGSSVDMWSVGVILYVLLCGFPPFYGKDEQELFERIGKAQYKFLRPYWDSVSADARDLVKKLLELDPEKRFTAAQALEHPWFSASPDAGNTNLSSALTELKRYNATRKLRKGVFAVLAANKLRLVLESLAKEREQEKAGM